MIDNLIIIKQQKISQNISHTARHSVYHTNNNIKKNPALNTHLFSAAREERIIRIFLGQPRAEQTEQEEENTHTEHNNNKKLKNFHSFYV